MNKAQGTKGDLLETLKRIEEEARTCADRVAKGEVPKGSSSLRKIQHEASDARRRAGVA